MFYDFLLENWFDLLQTVFIVIGFALSYTALRNDARASRVDQLLQLNQSYRDIWAKTYSHPELLRIRETEADLEKYPITEAEERMVKEVILHIYTIHVAVINNQLEGDEIERDFTDYLQLPIPSTIWKRVKGYYPKRFASYIDNLLRNEAN